MTAYIILVVIVADGITTFWLMLLPGYCGRWNYHLLADVIANMANGIAIFAINSKILYSIIFQTHLQMWVSLEV